MAVAAHQRRFLDRHRARPGRRLVRHRLEALFRPGGLLNFARGLVARLSEGQGTEEPRDGQVRAGERGPRQVQEQEPGRRDELHLRSFEVNQAAS